MSVVRSIALAGLAAQLAGCFVFSMPPSVPKVNRPNLGPDVFLDSNSRTVKEASSRGETTRVCSGGDCASYTTYRPTTVRVRAAAPTADGSPISIGELAAATSPEFVSDTERGRSMTSKCRRGRIIMTAGATVLAATYVLLQMGLRSDDPNRAAAVAGFATLGAGIGGLALGHFVAGGQYCDDANELYRKWKTVYRDPGATEVTRDAAELVEVLVDKFNRDRAATRTSKAPEPPDEPTEEPTDEPAED